ncbi:MAG: sulfurtransferase TusA family protein [Brevundimonas sp.]|uniref:sulfurtransferase TusA family protein n=1 Tax=Brevundimonas sp. TaxID=1871086 RepID=UPI002603DB49|nr:sulfurtransferase TusA family protein [Brevundimonas sp.]MDI6624585.1 sulfurtransferase TusA family protein [Brevundimonas sp.]MDQ7811326.1 sulfurtransferase TusA family protein [Brevundimonas sp.]
MIVDARGHRCPTPSLRLQKAMRIAAPATRLTLLATDPMARIDVPHLMAGAGGRVLSIEETDGVLTIEVETPAVPTG